MFRENSDVVPVSRLKRQGVQAVTVLDWKRIESLIGRAIDQVFAARGDRLAPAALANVNREVREAFMRLLHERDALEDSAAQLERQKRELQDNLARLRDELRRSSGELADELKAHQDASAVGADGAALAARFEAEVRDLLAALGTPDAGSAAARVRERAADLLREGHAAALREVQQARGERIDNLERRVAKLRSALTDSESLVERLRTTKVGDPGLASVYRTVQGLDKNTIGAAERQGLLDELFKLNVELRDMIQGIDKGAAAGAR
jgi:hypothetical protein